MTDDITQEICAVLRTVGFPEAAANHWIQKLVSALDRRDARIAALEAALRPFAEAKPVVPLGSVVSVAVPKEALERAAAVLGEAKETE